MRDPGIVLTEQDLVQIRGLAVEVRKQMGIGEDVPAAKELRRFLEKKDILLCEYPFTSTEDAHLDATIMRFEGNNPMVFIGLNSNLYYDEQIFALAHELYHYYTHSGMAYTQDMASEDSRLERQADRFAAELLLPRDALASSVYREFQGGKLDDVPRARLLRFISGLHVEWWLTYRSTVNRLQEEGYIGPECYKELYAIDARSEQGEYDRLLRGLYPDAGRLLNTRTRQAAVTDRILECVIENYEEERITDDAFVRLLELFGKKPEDLGFSSVMAEPDDDLANFLKEDADEG